MRQVRVPMTWWRPARWAGVLALAWVPAVPALGRPVAPPPAAPVADAAMRGDLAAVRALVQQGGSVHAAQGDGMTALHWAAWHGDSAMTAVLLRARASLAAATRVGAHTPLHVAARQGQAPVVRVLLRAGADVAERTAEGATALHLAALAGDTGVIGALLRRGAAVDATEPWLAQTPLMVAAERGHLDVVRALLEHPQGGALLDVTGKVRVPDVCSSVGMVCG